MLPVNSQESKIDLSKFHSNLSLRNRLTRAIWSIAWCLLFRPSPRIAFRWRSLLLKCFGAQLSKGVRVYNSVKIFLPSNLTLEENVIVGPDVDLYCVARIHIQANALISQYAHLCTATHDYRVASLPLVAKPITVESQAWICAGAFLGPGVCVGERAIVGAKAVAFRDVQTNTIVVGNPAKYLKDRDV